MAASIKSGKPTFQGGAIGGRHYACSGFGLLDYLAQAQPWGVAHSGRKVAASRSTSAGSDAKLSRANLARLLARQGRRGDTMVAHISPGEALLLRLLGGAGTTNPKTGLPEYYMSSAGPSGGGTGKADRDAANAGTALGGGRGGQGGGGNGGLSRDQIDKLATGGDFSTMNGPDVTRTKRGMAGFTGAAALRGLAQTAADYEVARKMGLSPDAYSGLAGAVRDQVTDTYNDGFGGLLDRLFGLRERMNYDRALAAAQQATQTGGALDPTASQADWGFDPAGLLGGALGTALGIPGLGLVAGQISNALGRPMEINLGPDVFGGSSSSGSSSGSPSSSGSRSGGQVARGSGPGNNLNDIISRLAHGATSPHPGPTPTSPATPTTPATPLTSADLLKNLYPQSTVTPGPIPGYSGTSRFGTATISPLQWYRTTA